MRVVSGIARLAAAFVLLSTQCAMALDIYTAFVDGTWAIEDSPVYVHCSIIVRPGYELIIEPGVEVRFTGQYYFRVQGVFEAAGAPGDTILLTSHEPQEYQWLGIRFDHAEPGCILDHCRIGWCQTSVDPGAGVRVESCSPIIRNSTIAHCVSGGDGGGVYLNDSNSSVANCTIALNTSHGDGGGVAIEQCSVTVSGCDIRDNVAEHLGGGLHLLELWSCIITDCTVAGNRAYNGGGVFAGDILSLSIEGCDLASNEATMDGGGAFLTWCEVSILGCRISDNSALSSSGGGLYLYSPFPQEIEHTTISGNSASNGVAGGIYYTGGTALVLRHATVCDNHANVCGGLWVEAFDAFVLLEDSIFAHDTQHPEIWIDWGATVDISHCNIFGGPQKVSVGVGTVNWLEGNIFDDPLLCDEVPLLQDCSPCLGASTGGSDIGSSPAGCPCGDPTAVQTLEVDATWTRIKEMFR